jgi:hypothetical protein
MGGLVANQKSENKHKNCTKPVQYFSSAMDLGTFSALFAPRPPALQQRERQRGGGITVVFLSFAD